MTWMQHANGEWGCQQRSSPPPAATAAATARSLPATCCLPCAAAGRRQLPGAQPMQHQLPSATAGSASAAAGRPAALRSSQGGEGADMDWHASQLLQRVAVV